MEVERAGIVDIDTLVELRLAYLLEDNGYIDAVDEEAIRRGLPDYYQVHLNKDLFVFVLREGCDIVSCAFLLVVEKPMSPAFLSGRTGTVLNVYTRPASRRKGYAGALMRELLDEAKRQNLADVELKATEDGYPLYRSVGFVDDHSKYHLMKWVNE